MNRPFLLLALISLLSLAVGCGSNNSTPGSGPTPTGNFSIADLNGQYTYQFSGTDLNFSPNLFFRRSGVFSANGGGVITSGTDDFSEQGNTAVSTPISGVYSVNSDGTGSLTLTLPTGSLIFAITLVDSSTVYMVEDDNTLLTGGGVAEQQTSSAFATVPSGNFAFRMHTIDVNAGSIGCAGVLTASGGVLTGTEDISSFDSGSGQFITVTHAITSGTLNTPDPTTGRGTGSYTDDTNFTTTFDYYVVDGNNLRFFSTTPNEIAVGRAAKQSGSFSNNTLSGNYVFGLRGDTLSNFFGANTVGRFTASNGALSSGAFDGVRDGLSSTNVTFTGSYTVASNGRAVLTITPSSGGSTQHIYYLVNSSQAYVLINDPNAVAEGTVNMQSGSFSNSTVNGQFALLMDGADFIVPETIDRIATLTLDGAGHLTLDELENDSGAVNVPGPVTGTYSVASNGRMTGSISGLSNNLIFYLSSGSNGVALQNDANVELSGTISKQP